LYGRFCHTTHHTNPGKKSAPPLFLVDENFFQKSASIVQWAIEFPIVLWRTIFEKSSHLREKGGVLMLFKTTRHLGAKAQYKNYTRGILDTTKPAGAFGGTFSNS
jgi:hypothetical protein